MINTNVFRVKKDGKLYKQSFCKNPEQIENYTKAMEDPEMWDCHHRLEISPTGKSFSKKRLIELGLYYNVEPNALIFLPQKEHLRLHRKYFKHTNESKKKISFTSKGRTAWNKGANCTYKNKISESVKRLWENPEYRKYMSEAHKHQYKKENGAIR